MNVNAIGAERGRCCERLSYQWALTFLPHRVHWIFCTVMSHYNSEYRLGNTGEPPCFFISNSHFDWGSHVSFSRHQLCICWSDEQLPMEVELFWICKYAERRLRNLSQSLSAERPTHQDWRYRITVILILCNLLDSWIFAYYRLYSLCAELSVIFFFFGVNYSCTCARRLL